MPRYEEVDYGERESIFAKMVLNDDRYEAILFNDGESDFWVPRSLLFPPEHYIGEVDEEGYCTIELPVWYAEQEGLI